MENQKIKQVKFSLFLLLLLTISSYGCAAYRTHDIPEPYEFNETCNTRARLIINATHFANGTVSPPGSQGMRPVDRYTKSATEFFEKANIFQEVGTDVQNPDIEITFNIIEEEQFSKVLTIFSGLTLMVIPTIADVVHSAEVQVSTPDGKIIANYSAVTNLKVIIEILLIPTIPTFFIIAPKATEDLYQMITLQMRNDPAMKQFCPQFSQM